jgi:hypothetical protein
MFLNLNFATLDDSVISYLKLNFGQLLYDKAMQIAVQKYTDSVWLAKTVNILKPSTS